MTALPPERLGGLRAEVEGAVLDRLAAVCPVDTSDGGRAEQARDWWPITLRWARDGDVPALPAAVARPQSAAQVAAVLAVCNQAGVPVTPAGGRSGVCGGAVPVHGGVSLDLKGLSGVVGVDDESLLVTVGAGTNGAALEDELRAAHGLTVGHRPQSIAISTVGGWLACRSAGQYSTRYGKIEDMAVDLEVALADGRVVRTGAPGPRSATGPDLTQLFVGSEGTLGVITEAVLRAAPVPPAERRAAFGFATFESGLDACRRVLRRGATPAVIRLYDEVESARSMGVDGRCVLLVLDEAEPRLADAVLHVVGEECGAAERLDDALVDRWLDLRDDVSALDGLLAAGMVVDTCEVAGPWSALGGMYRAGRSALEAVPGTMAASAHQSHAYRDGACLYFTFAGRRDDGTGDDYYREAWDAVTEAVGGAGGSLSHHHGVGLNRARFLPAARGGGWAVLLALKEALDPNGILNPGKLGLPSPWGAPPWP
ncbi:MAG TPA: FAD-binding oxidoreductase [Acidimicrobiales bacterium]|jgi:alkyldihydroxyacetonephosphate synthase|nr:FAD-binding oxidoreductase [Acidimicrobiales bacterium]